MSVPCCNREDFSYKGGSDSALLLKGRLLTTEMCADLKTKNSEVSAQTFPLSINDVE